MWRLLMWDYTKFHSSILRLHNFQCSCNVLPTCQFSNVAQRLSKTSFTLFAQATWCNKKKIIIIDIVSLVNLFFFMNKWCSWVPLSKIKFPNLVYGAKNSFKVISHKKNSCTKKFIFAFQVWNYFHAKLINASNIKIKCHDCD
jgi:hypothetical protein